MNSTDIVERWRSDIDDVVDPYLWSDDEAYSYLDDAQKMFCRETLGIEDVVEIALVPDVEWYAKPSTILKVRGASYTAPEQFVNRRIEVVNFETHRRMTGYHVYGRPGRCVALVDGVKRNMFRADAMPQEAATIELAVMRLPITINCYGDQELEIEEHHHLHLIDWMQARAYRKHDSDTFDPKAATEFEQRFFAYCAMAKVEQIRATHVPSTVQYGGI